MKDDYNVKRYIPKKYHPDIEEISLELDFDNSKNRNVKYYSVCFKDGSKITGIGIKNLISNIKKLKN